MKSKIVHLETLTPSRPAGLVHVNLVSVFTSESHFRRRWLAWGWSGRVDVDCLAP
jgi:hypothetical protein